MKRILVTLAIVGLASAAAVAADLVSTSAPASATATAATCSTATAATAAAGTFVSPYAAWKNGPPKDPNFFPLGVWLQKVDKAAQYKAIGINFYIGLWEGPTEADMAALKKAGMPLICDMNEVALKHLDDPTIIGWMHEDEPDNAREIGKFWKSAEEIKKAWPELPEKPFDKWGTYGPPMSPRQIIEGYQTMKAKDPTRPIYLGVGQSVAWDAYIGRGVRSNKPEDYPEYLKGCDIVSFDIYPVVHDNPDIKGKLERVPFGVDRLIKWTGGQKPVWNAMETTRIGNPDVKPTPGQVRSEVWMALIHGSRGIVYFAHEFKPNFIEAGLLADQEMADGVAAINKQIISLAPALNSPTLAEGAKVASSNQEVPIDIMAKQQGGATYVFAVAMRNVEVKGTFTVAGLPAKAVAEVIDEGRQIEVSDGKFADDFKGYQVHLYKITAAK